MNIKDQIRAEIERRFWDYGTPLHDEEVTKKVDEILDFLDTLPEQPVEGLEEEMFKERGTTKEEYLAKSMDKVHLEMEIATYLQDWEDNDEIGLHLSTDEGCMPIELEDIRDLARHFAEWGATHLKK